jgi:hypothetical protein
MLSVDFSRTGLRHFLRLDRFQILLGILIKFVTAFGRTEKIALALVFPHVPFRLGAVLIKVHPADQIAADLAGNSH